MRRMYARKLILLLICLYVLTATAYLQSGDQKQGRQPAHLYRVTMRDEKSGEKKTGFIDNTGKLVIGFDRLPAGAVVGDFSEGLAPICYLDASGGGCRGQIPDYGPGGRSGEHTSELQSRSDLVWRP